MSNEYGRKPYLGKDQSYTAMQRAMTDKTMRELNAERYAKHSMFKKPYLSDAYRDMEHFGYDGKPWDGDLGNEVSIGDGNVDGKVCKVICFSPDCDKGEIECIPAIWPQSCGIDPDLFSNHPAVVRIAKGVRQTFKFPLSIDDLTFKVCLVCGDLETDCCAEVIPNCDTEDCSCTEITGSNTMTTGSTNQLTTTCSGGEWGISGDEAQGNISISASGLVTSVGGSCGTYTANYTCGGNIVATQKIRITNNGSWDIAVLICSTGGCTSATFSTGASCIEDDEAIRYQRFIGNLDGGCTQGGSCVFSGCSPSCSPTCGSPAVGCCQSPCGTTISACQNASGQMKSQDWIC